MPDIRVVLMEPKNEGNVGAVARSIRNFGASELVLARPCRIGDEARKRAMHGVDILDSARIVEDFAAATDGADYVVGTSGIDTASEKHFARIAMTPKELASRISPLDGRVALVFGREDFGLFDHEIRRCDALVTIPAAPAYPILNLSHAAAILLYEIHAAQSPGRARRKASGAEKEKLYEALANLMRASDYPPHKRGRTQVMFRRLLGRAVPTPWEFHAFMGVLQRATKRIERLEGTPRK